MLRMLLRAHNLKEDIYQQMDAMDSVPFAEMDLCLQTTGMYMLYHRTTSSSTPFSTSMQIVSTARFRLIRLGV